MIVNGADKANLTMGKCTESMSRTNAQYSSEMTPKIKRPAPSAFADRIMIENVQTSKRHRDQCTDLMWYCLKCAPQVQSIHCMSLPVFLTIPLNQFTIPLFSIYSCGSSLSMGKKPRIKRRNTELIVSGNEKAVMFQFAGECPKCSGCSSIQVLCQHLSAFFPRNLEYYQLKLSLQDVKRQRNAVQLHQHCSKRTRDIARDRKNLGWNSLCWQTQRACSFTHKLNMLSKYSYTSLTGTNHFKNAQLFSELTVSSVS